MAWFNIINETSGLVIVQVYGCKKAKKICENMQKNYTDRLIVEKQENNLK